MYENIVMGRRSSGGVVTETMEMRRRVRKVQGEGNSLAGTDRSGETPELRDNVGSLLFDSALAVWAPFLEKMCGEYGVVVEKFYSMLTFQPPQHLDLEAA